MNSLSFWPQLLLFYALAVYRMSTLLSIDSGPWRFLSRFRSWLKREEKKSPALKKADAAKGVECLRCNSVHLAFAVASYAYFRPEMWAWFRATGDIFLSGMSLSALVILFNRALPPKP